MKKRLPTIWEAVAALAAVAALLWGVYEHGQNIQKTNSDEQHAQIISAIKAECDTREKADANLRAIVEEQTRITQEQSKSIASMIAQVHIVLIRLHLDGGIN
jgi:hypothetical protein